MGWLSWSSFSSYGQHRKRCADQSNLHGVYSISRVFATQENFPKYFVNIIGDDSFCLDMGSSSCTYKGALSNISLEEIPIIFFKLHVFLSIFCPWLNFVTLRFFFWTSLHSAQLRMCSRQFPGTEGWNSPKSFWLFHHRPQVKKSEDSYYLCPLAQCGLVHLVEFGFIWLSLVWCSAHVPFLAHSVWLYGSPRETQRPWESLSTNLFNVSSPACPTLILKREQINSPFI